MKLQTVIQIIAAFFGTFGFCLLFRMKWKTAAIASLGGAIGWAIYLAMYKYTMNVFWSCFTASAFGELYAELLALRLRVPSIIISLPTVVPLIPGGDLYYCMSYLVQGSKYIASWYAKETLLYALAIAGGLSMIGAVWKMAFQRKSYRHRW